MQGPRLVLNRRCVSKNLYTWSSGSTNGFKMTRNRAMKGLKRPNKATRKENKKKKLAALLAVAHLNDADRRVKAFARPNPGNEETNGQPPLKKIKTENKKENEEVKPNDFKEINKELRELEVKELQRLCRERARLKFERPNIKINELGLKSSINNPESDRIPMFLSDVQHFLIYSQLLHHSTGNIPRWIKIDKPGSVNHTIFLIIEGISYLDYENNKSECPNLFKIENKLEVVTPLSYGGDFINELATVPLTNNQINKIEKRYGSLKEACDGNKVCKVLRTIYPVHQITNKIYKEVKVEQVKNENPVDIDAFPRTHLLLTPWQMVENNYPLPLEGELKSRYASYIYTKDSYPEVSEHSPIWAIDCEMCLTRNGNELTEISVINENLELVYHTLVKPYSPIKNYLTKYSGITKQKLDPVWTRLEDVQAKLKEILPPDVILVGHSLENDLHALKMFHPYIIDTAIIFNLSGKANHKSGLRVITAEFLSERIQSGTEGHDPTEDATAAMKLVKAKLKRRVGWGNAVISGVRSAEESLAAHQLLLDREKNKGNELIKKVEQIKKDDVEKEPQKNVKNEMDKFTFENNVLKRNQGDSANAYMYMSSILKHLTGGNKKVLLIGKKNVLDEYERFVPPTYKLNSPKCPVKLKILKTSKAVIKHGRDNKITDGLTFMHVVAHNHLKADNLVGKLLKNIIYGEDKHKNILVSVLLTGKTSDEIIPENNHGLFLVQMFRKYVEPIPAELKKNN